MGGPLLTSEALRVLSLRPGASPSEIKGAYRDLVKVWHPDRFGEDARLRQKAEEKLREVNEAYRVLQAGSVVEAEGATSSVIDEASKAGWSTSAPMPRTARWGRSAGWDGAWIYACVGVALGCLVGYTVLERGGLRAARSAPVRQVVDASQELRLVRFRLSRWRKVRS